MLSYMMAVLFAVTKPSMSKNVLVSNRLPSQTLSCLSILCILLYGIICTLYGIRNVLCIRVRSFILWCWLLHKWVGVGAGALLLNINTSELICSYGVQHTALITLMGQPVWRTLIETYSLYTTLFILADGRVWRTSAHLRKIGYTQ